MKKTIKIMFLCAIVLFLFSTVCMATDTLTALPNQVATSKMSICNTDAFIANSENITVSDYINGNAFILGQNVTVTGSIDGDLFVISKGTLTIDSSAKISGNLFALADQIELNGSVCDVYACSSNFSIGNTGYIYRDLKIYSKNTAIQGKIGKDAYIATDQLKFAENQKNLINGNLSCSSTNELQIPDGIVVGNVEFKQITKHTPSTAEIIKNYIISFISIILYAVTTILLTAFLTSKFADKITYCISKKYLASAGIGILALIVIPILSIFLLVTGFLTYIGLALFTVYILVLSITISILGMASGNYFANKFKNKTKGKFILLSIASVTVLWLLQQIPTVGNYVSIFTVVFGLGIFVYSLFVKEKQEK